VDLNVGLIVNLNKPRTPADYIADVKTIVDRRSDELAATALKYVNRGETDIVLAVNTSVKQILVIPVDEVVKSCEQCGFHQISLLLRQDPGPMSVWVVACAPSVGVITLKLLLGVPGQSRGEA